MIVTYLHHYHNPQELRVFLPNKQSGLATTNMTKCVLKMNTIDATVNYIKRKKSYIPFLLLILRENEDKKKILKTP
jgi:hypothetical protein